MTILDRLTPGKIDVLRMLCAGMSHEEIAAIRGISLSAVISSRTEIMNRSARGATLRDVCVLAAAEAPTFTISLDLGKHKSTIRRTSR